MSSPVISVTQWPKVADVDSFFPSITDDEITSYQTYWRTLTPEDYLETFERWLFAFCSVHTSWTANVRGFNAIRSWINWYQDSNELKQRLENSRIGLHVNRTKFIGKFCDDYWANPQLFYLGQGENWVQYRDRLVKRILGLGLAKVSFALEMIYPCAAEVVCLDTHMFQFYGLDQSKHARHYKALERHWVAHCLDRNVSSAIARAIYWDRKQKRTDSRYWTYVLERNPTYAQENTSVHGKDLVNLA